MFGLTNWIPANNRNFEAKPATDMTLDDDDDEPLCFYNREGGKFLVLISSFQRLYGSESLYLSRTCSI